MEQMPMNSANIPRWPTWLSLAGLVLVTAVCIFAASQIIQQYAHMPPDFDESVHLLPVRQLAVDLQRGDVAAFVRHTLNQDMLAAYPFLHSWLTFPVWFVSPTITAVRVTSVLFLLPSVVLAFAIGHDLPQSERFRWLAALVSGGLLLCSFPLWVYGGLAYLEGAGLCLTLLALWLYGRSSRNGRWAKHANRYALFASFAVAGAFFTKYNFGLFLIGGIVLNEVVQLLLEVKQQEPSDGRLRRWQYLAAQTAVLLVLWFIYPGHWQRFWAFSNAQEGGLTVWQVESWLYYGRSFFQQYLAGWPFILLAGAGLGYAVWSWRNFSVRALLLYTVVGWLLLIWVPQKAPRFLYTVAPAVFPLSGVFAAVLAAWWYKQERPLRLGVALVAVMWLLWAGTAVGQRFRFFEAAVAAGYVSAPETVEAYQFVAEHTLAQNQRVVILNGWHLFSGPGLQWAFHIQNPENAAAFDKQLVTTILVPEPTPENVEAVLQELYAQGITTLLSIDGSPAGSHSGWSLVEPLLAQGVLEPVASSGPFLLPTKSFALQEALLSGEINNQEALETAVSQERGSLTIHLHLYRVQN